VRASLPSRRCRTPWGSRASQGSRPLPGPRSERSRPFGRGGVVHRGSLVRLRVLARRQGLALRRGPFGRGGHAAPWHPHVAPGPPSPRGSCAMAGTFAACWKTAPPWAWSVTGASPSRMFRPSRGSRSQPESPLRRAPRGNEGPHASLIPRFALSPHPLRESRAPSESSPRAGSLSAQGSRPAGSSPPWQGRVPRWGLNRRGGPVRRRSPRASRVPLGARLSPEPRRPGDEGRGVPAVRPGWPEGDGSRPRARSVGGDRAPWREGQSSVSESSSSR
jgi:hypothetical protein